MPSGVLPHRLLLVRNTGFLRAFSWPRRRRHVLRCDSRRKHLGACARSALAAWMRPKHALWLEAVARRWAHAAGFRAARGVRWRFALFAMLAAAHASTERIADAARLSQLGMDVGGGTTAVVLSVEECNRQFRPLAEAYATAKSLEDSELMDELRPQLDLWRGRIKAAAAAGANAALKREAEEDFCDNGDISAAKVLKTASGAPAVTAPLSEAARAAGVSALAQRPRALQAGLVSVLTPVVAADVKALPSGGTNLRQAVTTVALAHASGAVKDMANMPGEPGEKMQMAFKAAMTVAEKVSKVGAVVHCVFKTQ